MIKYLVFVILMWISIQYPIESDHHLLERIVLFPVTSQLICAEEKLPISTDVSNERITTSLFAEGEVSKKERENALTLNHKQRQTGETNITTQEPVWLKIITPVLSFLGSIIGAVLSIKLEDNRKKREEKKKEMDTICKTIIEKLVSFKAAINENANYRDCYYSFLKDFNEMIDLRTAWNAVFSKYKCNIDELLSDLNQISFDFEDSQKLKENACDKIDTFIKKAKERMNKA